MANRAARFASPIRSPGITIPLSEESGESDLGARLLQHCPPGCAVRRPNEKYCNHQETAILETPTTYRVNT